MIVHYTNIKMSFCHRIIIIGVMRIIQYRLAFKYNIHTRHSKYRFNLYPKYCIHMGILAAEG